MSTVYKVVAGMGILIALYLILSRPDATTNIIRSISSTVQGTASTFQGR